MLKAGSDVFLQRPCDAGERILHCSTIVEGAVNSFTTEITHMDLVLEVGQTITIYYNLHGKFVKQPAIVTLYESQSLDDESTRTLFGIEKSGSPVAADDRQCFRVSIGAEGLTIEFGDNAKCPFVDVSPTGFGVISPEEFEVDNTVFATPRFEELQATGQVQIQSVRALRDGRYRYGVRCLDNSLNNVLQQISMALQRVQLRRLAGNA